MNIDVHIRWCEHTRCATIFVLINERMAFLLCLCLSKSLTANIDIDFSSLMSSSIDFPTCLLYRYTWERELCVSQP